MEFDKPDKEVQRPRGNDVADQACSRSCGWRGELREPSAVAAAASTAEEHATRVPPTEMPEMATTHQGFEHCAASISCPPGCGARLSPPVAFRIGCSRVIS